MGYNVTQAPTTKQAGQSEQTWIQQAAANGWNDPQALLAAIQKYQGSIVPSGNNDLQNDPTLQKLVDQGYLSPVSSGGEGGSDAQTYGAANTPQSALGWAPAFFQGMPKQGGGITVNDPNAVTNDPLFGLITGNSNLTQQKTLLDTIGPMIPLMFAALPAMLAAGAEGAGAEGALSAGMNTPGLSLAKTGWSLTQGFGSGSFQSILDMLKGGGSMTTPAATTPSPSGGTGTINPQQLQAILPFILRLLQGSGNTGG